MSSKIRKVACWVEVPNKFPEKKYVKLVWIDEDWEVNPRAAQKLLAYGSASDPSSFINKINKGTCSAPHTLQTVGVVMTKLVPKSTEIPTKKSQVFTTHQDQQIDRFHSGGLTKDCRNLGKFHLNGIPPPPRGIYSSN